MPFYRRPAVNVVHIQGRIRHLRFHENKRFSAQLYYWTGTRSGKIAVYGFEEVAKGLNEGDGVIICGLLTTTKFPMQNGKVYEKPALEATVIYLRKPAEQYENRNTVPRKEE